MDCAEQVVASVRGQSWAAALLGLVLAACRDPTGIVVEVYTDVPCTDELEAGLFVGQPGKLAGRSVSATSQRCESDDGFMGDVVLHPSEDRTGEVAFQIGLQVEGEPAEACIDATTTSNCIIARRILRYLPHEELKVRVDLRDSCLNIPCDQRSTCVGRRCVEAAIDDPKACQGNACTEELLSPAVDCSRPEFADPNLERLVLDALGVSSDELTPELLESVKEIDEWGSDVSDLSGIECLTGLEVLRLHRSHVSDLTPLAELESLYELNVGETEVENIAPLEGLSLQALMIDGNDIEDFSPLESLRKLEYLAIQSTSFANEDIEYIQHLPTLFTLRMVDVQATDFSGLGDIATLDHLSVGGPLVDDVALASLAEVTRLASLAVNDIPAEVPFDIDFLASLPRLEALDFSNTPVADEDLPAIAALSQLTTLELAQTNIATTAPLVSLLNLTTLDLQETLITDLAPLLELPLLNDLRLNNTPIDCDEQHDNLVELQAKVDYLESPCT